MQRQHAFTLIEMLITFSLIALLTAISFSALRQVTEESDDAILQSRLLQLLAFARAEASARRVPISLCKSSDHFTCQGEWAQGQIVFIDEKAEGKVGNKQQILAVNQGDSRHGVLHWRAYPHYRENILFVSDERMRSDNGTFWYCHAGAASPAWAISLAKTGSARVLKVDADGAIKDDHGNPLHCSPLPLWERSTP